MQKLSRLSLLQQIMLQVQGEAEGCPVKQSAACLQPVSCFKPYGVVLGYSFNLMCDPQLLKSTAEPAFLPWQV